MVDAEFLRRKPVRVKNPRVELGYTDEQRRALFDRILLSFPLPLRPAIQCIVAADSYPLYAEGHLVEIEGVQWVVALRLWNSKSGQVWCVLVKPNELPRVLTEEIVMANDALHAATVDAFYRERHRNGI